MDAPRFLISALASFLLCSAFTASAQKTGESLKKDALGVTLSSGSTTTRVEVWNDGVVRVTHQPAQGAAFPQSLTVTAHPQAVKWSLSDSGDEAALTMPQGVVRLNKLSGCVRFINPQGEVILSEAENGTAFRSQNVGSAKDTLGSSQRFALDSGEAIYGLGQHPEIGQLNNVGRSIKLLQENTKVAVPVMLSSKGYGMLWDNPAVTTVDVGKTEKSVLTWESEAGFGVDYFVFMGPSPDQSVADYRWLTGVAPMFAKWTWGFWQSRERYKSQQEILGIASEYRQRHIPLDGVIQDWQFWAPLNQESAGNGWGSHEFDKSRYPDPAGMFRQLHDMHTHLMVVSWAKFDVTDKNVSIPNLRELEAVNGVFEPAIPYVFPKGRGKWYDPYNDRARSVYWRLLSRHLFHLGVDAWWLDASEAELSGKWGEFRDFKTGKGPGALVFNAYPLEHTRAVYEGQRSENSDKRVFTLTRSAYAGQQRNGAVSWSGDIPGTWDVFAKQIPAGLNFCASGIPYWNTDIGGFFGDDPAKPAYAELFTRWFQFGAFCPMFRVHGTNKPKEVWRFDEPTQHILTDFITLRYHLLPYIYSVSWKVTHDGYTMMRPLVMDFSHDAQALGVSDQFLFGSALLVNPVTKPGAASREVYLPAGCKWIDFWTGKSLEGGQKTDAPAPIGSLPLYVKAGSILPYGPEVQYAAEKPDAPMELRVYRGANGDFTLYEDEGDSYRYERGAYATVSLQWDEAAKVLRIGARKGAFPGMQKTRLFRVVWVAPDHGQGIASTAKPDVEVRYTGAEISVPGPR